MKKISIVLTLFSLAFVNSAFAQKEFTISGIMQHTDLEDGCWYLLANNDRYELTGSPEDIARCNVEGRQLTLRVRFKPMMASTCMIGKRIEVLEVYDTVFHPRDPQIIFIPITGTIHKLKKGCWYVKTEKFKYELEEPFPLRYQKIGATYSRKSKVIPGESICPGMVGKIVFGLEEMKKQGVKERKYNPK